VYVRGGESNQVIIDAVKRVHAVSMEEAEIVADHVEIRVEQSSDRIDVTTNYLRMTNRSPNFWEKILGAGGSPSYGDVDFTITIPPGTRISVASTSGDITVQNIYGDVSLYSSAANIDMNTVEGAISIENGSGRTIGEMLFGPVTIRQPRGEVSLSWVEGDIRVKSMSADIDISQDRGAADISTQTGSVTIRTSLNSARDFFVETGSGNIQFLVPELSSGQLRLASDLGQIQTDVPVSIESYSRTGLKGTFGLGGVQITLQSGSGDVSVAQF
jgi:DUF4097 and DUF4098 domain-containing protein YvlB